MRTAIGTARLYTCRPRWMRTRRSLWCRRSPESTTLRSLQRWRKPRRWPWARPQRMNVIADAGYSNGEQAEACEGKESFLMYPQSRDHNQATAHLRPHRLPVTRTKATLVVCPAGQTLTRKQLARRSAVIMQLNRRSAEPATQGSLYSSFPALRDTALPKARWQAWISAHVEIIGCGDRQWNIRLPPLEVPHLRHPRFLLRGLRGAQTRDLAVWLITSNACLTSSAEYS